MTLGPMTWNATTTAIDGANRTVDFRGKWVNWLDQSAGGVWKQIDPSFNQVGNVFRADQGPWIIECPETATGAITLVNRQQFDVLTKDSLNLPEMELTVTHPGANNVIGTIIPGREWQVCYTDAIDDGIDIVGGIWHGRGPRAEHVYVIRKMPPGDSDYVPITCEISAPGRWLPIPNGIPVDLSNGGAARLPTDQRRGIRIRPLVAWYYDADGEIHVVPITGTVRRINVGRTELIKYVPRSLIAAALAVRPNGELRVDTTTTFYPDADSETTSFDGHCQRVGGIENWATIRAGVGTSVDDTATSASAIRVTARNTPGDWQVVRRGLFVFDTSSLGSGASVSSATLSLYGASQSNGFSSGSPKANIYQATTTSSTAATASDFEACGTTAFSTGIAYASWSVGAYNAYTLNASGLANISVAGVSKFSAREETYDAGGTTYPWTSNATMTFDVDYAESTGTTTDPKLVVTYTAAGGTAYLMMMMGSG